MTIGNLGNSLVANEKVKWTRARDFKHLPAVVLNFFKNEKTFYYKSLNA